LATSISGPFPMIGNRTSITGPARLSSASRWPGCASSLG
jgi:hypothetical protein